MQNAKVCFPMRISFEITAAVFGNSRTLQPCLQLVALVILLSVSPVCRQEIFSYYVVMLRQVSSYMITTDIFSQQNIFYHRTLWHYCFNFYNKMYI